MKQKKLGGNGLEIVWKKVFSLMKIITGDVDVAGKGNLQKQISDLATGFTEKFKLIKEVAFSGSYTDLSNKPTIPTVPASLKNPQALTFTDGVTGSYDGSAAKTVKIPSGTNSLLATVAGTWLDAVQGKILKGLYDQHETKITQINSDLSKKQVDFTLANGVTRQAGLSWLRGNIVCLSTCLKISKDIKANTNIITGMTAAGSPVKVEFTYGVCNQKGAKIIPLIAMQGIAYCEDDLLVADGEYIIISAACSLLN